MGGFDDGLEDDERAAREGEPKFGPPLPPDDRLWRHPSEVAQARYSPLGRERTPKSRIWTTAILAGFIGALVATVVSLAARPNESRRAVERVIERVAPADDPRRAPGGAIAAAEAVRSAVVGVVAHRDEGELYGSGVVFRDDGHLLTNDHLVQSLSQVAIILNDGRRLRGRVVGADRYTDVAVVKADGAHFSTARLGSASSLRPGQDCIIVGAPQNEGVTGEPSVSVGVVSGLGRSLQGDGRRLYDLIQTDAALSRGSAGGPLLDVSGSVIGVSTDLGDQGSSATAMSFAIPIDIAHRVADEMISNGKASHVWLGVEGGDLDRASAERLGINGGAQVRKVVEGSPAQVAGLTPGDIVVAVADRPVTTMAGLIVSLRARKVGEVVPISYLRETKRATTSVRLTERPT